MTTVPAQRVELNGVTVAYRVYGQGDRLVTCLHSLALDGSWWEPLADALGSEFRVLAPDLRGHGGTSAGSDLGLRAMAADVVALWDHLGIETSPVVGLSMGGMVAQALAADAPSRVSQLVLIATAHRFDDEALEGTQNRIDAVLAAGGLALMADTLIDRWFGVGASELTDVQAQRAHARLLRTDARTHARILRAMTQVNDVAPASTPPTLLISPEDDTSTPRSTMEALADVYRDARLESVPGSHLAPMSHPAPVADLLRDFVAS